MSDYHIAGARRDVKRITDDDEFVILTVWKDGKPITKKVNIKDLQRKGQWIEFA